MTQGLANPAASSSSRPKECTHDKLRRLMRRLSIHYDARLRQVGLKTTQFSLLARVGYLGPIRPADLAAAFPELFHVCHRFYLPASRVDPSERHALSTLRRDPGDVPLLPLPSGLDELQYLRPLLRAEVLKLYPKELRGPGSGAQARDPEEEWAKLVRAWRSG